MAAEATSPDQDGDSNCSRGLTSLLNAKSPRLDPNIVEGLDQWSESMPLGVQPTTQELTDAIHSLANGKTVGPDGVSVELFKIILNGDPALRWRLLGIVVRIWRESVWTVGGEGDTTIPSSWRSPKQPLPGIGLHDPLHGRQACPEFNSFYQGVGQIYPL